MGTKYPETLLKNALWVTTWRDLPCKTEPAQYTVTDEAGETRKIRVSKNKRRIIDALVDGPVHCASPCRLSHFVMGLREEQGLNIETVWFDQDPKAGRARFGIYKLLDQVTRIEERGVAA